MRRYTALAVILLTASAHALEAQRVTGIPTVIDGDTLRIREVKVRLWGIDAPEASQNCVRQRKVYGCGREAAFALADLVRQKNMTCTRKNTDQYGRMVGICTVGNVDVGRWLVERGHALPYMQYGGAVYQAAERSAVAAGRGLHAGTFQNPWAYRQNPLPAVAPPNRQPIPAASYGPPHRQPIPPAPAPAVPRESAGAPARAGGAGSGTSVYASCAAAWAAGAAPIRAGQTDYNRALDGDGDGVACEGG